jgi:hypothetical protein
LFVSIRVASSTSIINTDILPDLRDQILKYTPLKLVALPVALERCVSFGILPVISELIFSYRYTFYIYCYCVILKQFVACFFFFLVFSLASLFMATYSADLNTKTIVWRKSIWPLSATTATTTTNSS